ncbi:NAD+ synthase [bacterium]|nr:NAD+ synthase [bacterium]
MRIALGQINATVGDLAGNADLIAKRASEAADAGCELFLTPELTVTGYPPQDLLLKDHFVAEQLELLHGSLAPRLPIPSLVGFVDRGADGRRYNAAALVVGGKVERIVRKTLLPTYDVFDEWRYFRPAESNEPLEVGGRMIGVTICEDIWDEGYQRKVVPGLVEAGAEMIVNLSSSPFHAGKRQVRIDLCRRHALAHGVPVLYCNMVGAQDELIFDGESIAVDAAGRLIALGPKFREGLVVVECNFDGAPAAEVALPEFNHDEEVFDALCLGIAGYFRKCGFERAVTGLSGGIDSSLVACLAVEALGSGQVMGVAMPSRFTPAMSSEDASALATNLGIALHVMPIEESVVLAMQRYRDCFGEYQQGITAENLQARERGKILMEISNDQGALVLSTGNKTEYALGYTTLYGDMAGGLAVIGDVSKPEVYALARYYNARRGAAVIPERVLTRPPSAELSEGQVDPFDYERIGPLVDAVVEERRSRSGLLELGYGAEEVDRVLRLVRLNEYKRKQAPPVLRITKKAFGIGRKMPIVNKYEG